MDQKTPQIKKTCYYCAAFSYLNDRIGYCTQHRCYVTSDNKEKCWRVSNDFKGKV